MNINITSIKKLYQINIHNLDDTTTTNAWFNINEWMSLDKNTYFTLSSVNGSTLTCNISGNYDITIHISDDDYRIFDAYISIYADENKTYVYDEEGSPYENVYINKNSTISVSSNLYGNIKFTYKS